MIPQEVQAALATLAARLADRSQMDEAVLGRWRAGRRSRATERPGTELPEDVRMAADRVKLALPALTRSEGGAAALAEVLGGPSGEALFSWCAAASWRRDVELGPLLEAAAKRPEFRDRVPLVARDRVIEGPLRDALACAPRLAEVVHAGPRVGDPASVEARARLEILLWEAGASALEGPDLGPWIWGAPVTFEAMVGAPAHGALRGRVLAARCLEVAARGMPGSVDPELVGRTLQVLQPLLLHPEPLVWVHAARALGRLTGSLEHLEGMLLDWVQGESPLLRVRALTAFASLPSARLKFLAAHLVTILNAPDPDGRTLAAISLATPYLFFERRDLWQRLAARVLGGDGGALAARALARGLATLWRRGLQPWASDAAGDSNIHRDMQREIEPPMRALRELARRARPDALDESRRWIEVTGLTDAVDHAERDPLDLELGLENLMRLAAQYDDEEADARASRFAGAVVSTFNEARRIALGDGRLRQRAAAINALEGCARAFALRLWGPLLATNPTGGPIDPRDLPDLEETWKTIARSPAEILDIVKERRAQGGGIDQELSLEVLAVRLGGYALDACGESADLGPGRGPTAHDTCLWLRKLDGLTDGTRELPESLKSALSTLFWRLVDTTRGTALGEVDDVRWLGPFAAWWALVIDRPAVLQQLATALPMMAEGALTRCCDQAEALRTAMSIRMANGQWGPSVAEALEALHATDTELAASLADLSRALEEFAGVAGPKADLEAKCLELVLAGERLHAALADPVKALHTVSAASPAPVEDSLARAATENAPRVAALVARAIRTRDLTMLDVWFASLGTAAAALLEDAVRAAIRRTPPPPPKPRRSEPKIIEGYELVQPLGEGGVGSVWLVRKPGADRLFVLKIPKADTLSNASDTERAGILASFVEEAKALAGLYHPNVASIIDRGVSGNVPFLVLEYLIGADLRQYADSRMMTLFELREVVIEACAGLAALHSAGLVHRDIKPANLWLRLPLAGGQKFDPERHRDPATTPPLATVVIDFGMVRAIRVPPDVGGRFVAGTAGYIAPEQVLDPVELDPRSDVYALAGTIYNVTTGRAFFDDIENSRDRIIAHMRRDPFEDAERLRTFPAAVAKLLRGATARDPRDRPWPLEFGRAFVASL